MGFIKRLFGIVRGGTSVRAMGFGAAAGLLAGLPPVGLLTLVGLLLFAVLNANLWIFLLAAGVGVGLQLALPGVLHAVGHGLLETESLKGLWTALLNLPGIALMGLDHYVTMGGAALAVLLGLAAIVGGIVLFRKRGPTGDDGVDRRESRWIRRAFVWPMGIALVLGAIVFWFGGDGLARKAVALVAGQSLRKDVTVSSAKLGLLAGSLEIDELHVRDTDTGATSEGGKEDIASGKKFTVDLSMTKLLNRRFVVDKLMAENLVYRARPEDMPQVPEPPTGKGVGLADVLSYIEANEEQIRWVVDTLTTFLESADTPAPTPAGDGYSGRAAYVYANRTDPVAVLREAGISNLQLDWGEATGPLTKLKQLTLVAKNVSSNPARHKWPILFEGSGAYGKGTLKLNGRFDVRNENAESHGLDLGFTSKTFGKVGALGLSGGKDLAVGIVTEFDPKTKALRSAEAAGQFSAIGTDLVKFALGLGAKRTVGLTIHGFDLEKAAGIKMPETVRLKTGLLDIETNFDLTGGSLAGAFGVSAKNLQLAPGSAKKLAGLPADKFCMAVNALAGGAPLALGFKLGGTKDAPALSMEAEQLYMLLDRVKGGLLKIGEKALAAEVEKRLGSLAQEASGKIAALQAKLGTKAADAQKKLQARVGGEIGEVQKKAAEQVAGAQKKAAEALGGATKKLEGDLKKKAGGILGGLLGGKKKKDDK